MLLTREKLIDPSVHPFSGEKLADAGKLLSQLLVKHVRARATVWCVQARASALQLTTMNGIAPIHTQASKRWVESEVSADAPSVDDITALVIVYL